MQMRSYMERTNSMSREKKRCLDSSSGDESRQPDRKRPALASVIVEALKVDSLQRLCSTLEPILRRVVSEEVESALAKLGPSKLSVRSSTKQLEGCDGRKLQLRFRSRLSLPLFTGGKIEGEQGAAIHVVLVDANTGQIVTTGPESSAKLDVIVLEGDFNNEDGDNWSPEEFESHIVKEREGKRPLLTGDLQVTLKDGVGTLGELSFTDNSSWIRSRKFRLGLKVSPGLFEGIHIREAKTDAFTVKDHRGELYKKHYPPALHDEVWRLEKIGKDGSFHKRLNKAGILTVEDFLRLAVRDSQRLRNILGSGMSNKMWDVLVEHARTCVLSGKLYVYYPDDAKSVGVIFNNIYQFSGLIADGQYYSADSLSDDQKVVVDGLVQKAYDNWMHVIEYDGKTLVDFNQNLDLIASRDNVPTTLQDLPDSYDHKLVLPTQSLPVPQQQSTLGPGPTIAGYNDSMAAGYSMHQPNGDINATFHFDNTSLPIQNSLSSSSQQPHFPTSDNVLAISSLESSSSGLQCFAPSDHSSFRGMEDYFTEEEIRLKSHEMLENEDMQHLLRMLNAGGQAHTPFSSIGDAFPFNSEFVPAASPNYGFGFDQSRSGKAVIGWLKLKAALRWGIFTKKKAAEKRAQLVELDDC